MWIMTVHTTTLAAAFRGCARRWHTGQVRRLALGLLALAGCVELGVISDGTSVSVGRPSDGRIVDPVRLPDRGAGFMTREVWRTRNQRYGTDELIDLIVAVAGRMSTKVRDAKIVVADLSGPGGGEARMWHRSHQSGRDVDLLPYMRDADGKPFEPDAMHVFDDNGVARDGTGLTIDVPRTWLLVRELLTAPEATVQWVFMYQPIANKLIAYAEQTKEPEALLAKARLALKQPGDSARHDDHMHVRIYCSTADKAQGCIDIGPMDLWTLRQQELAQMPVLAAIGAIHAPPPAPEPRPSAPWPVSVAYAVASSFASAAAAPPPTTIAGADLRALGRILRTRDLVLRRWR